MTRQHRSPVTRVLVTASSLVVGATLVALPSASSVTLPPAPPVKVTALPCTTPLTSPTTAPSLTNPQQGIGALSQLGISLPAAASVNKMSTANLERILSTDTSAKLDACGRLLFVEAPAPAGAVSATPSGGLSVVGDPFALSSRPGSRRTLYLNFVGTTLTGTGWNASYGLPAGFALLPYDTDGNGASFSAAEQDAIRETWLRVAEDYAPFDVNVTTAPPTTAQLDRTSLADLDYGATAVITNDTTIMNQCGCGGIAYVGIMDTTGSVRSYYQPALVFTQNLGNGTPKYVGEATSHELGHNYGLSHDGTSTAGYYTGQGAWAPIMGASYYEPVTQWSNGDYANANQTQDDLAIIAASTPLVADDHGNAAASSTALTSGVTTSGVISTATDTDWFSFTSAAGPVSLALDPQSVGGNLDAALEIFAADGTTSLGVSNPPVPVPSLSRFTTTGLGASLSITVPAGTYFARVRGVGQGDPLATGYSAYASLGRYDLSLTAAPGFSPMAITTTSLPSATTGSAYSASLAATGGSGSRTWAITAGALPAGLTLSSAGLISGTPTTAGTSSATFTATDTTASMTSAVTLSITVVSPLVIATATVPEGTVATPYSTTLTTSGGDSTPITWTLAAGTLPAGLSLSSAGVISGTPSAATSNTVTVRATSTGSLTTTRALTVTVRAALAVTTATLAQGTTSAAYSATLTASGGSGGNVWTLASGALPLGLSLGGTGVISGTPTTAATSTFTVRVTDSAGRIATRALSIVVAAPLTITTAATLPSGRRNTAYAVTLLSSGGNGTKTWTRTAGTLPTGVTLSATGVLSGRPTRAGISRFTLQVRDASGRIASRAFTLTVA